MLRLGQDSGDCAGFSTTGILMSFSTPVSAPGAESRHSGYGRLRACLDSQETENVFVKSVCAAKSDLAENPRHLALLFDENLAEEP